ncbi:Putative odorant receptor 67a [Trachymyrmex zeteki]|uniref:Odorant receptor n=1 Tax=Mycetomoellerius zeteki TaxID=64791 RepID=A0A151X1Q9_9HYME|nr:Putative odorant receptor 67a [Trachymyrmex zeteki]
MEDYYKQANAEEKDVFQQYINKYILFYGTTLTLTTAITFAGCLIVPLIRSRRFPLEIEYPFPVDYQPITALLYFHQVLGMYQVTCQVSANVFLALLIWYTTARFEILTNKFRIVTKYSDWITCIQEHQVTLRYATEVTICARHFVLSTVCCSTFVEILIFLVFITYLVSEMEHTFECAEPYEKKIYQQYIDRCATFYASSTAAVFLCAVIATMMPLIQADQIFPTDAKYPFNVEHEPLKSIVFIHQCVAVWQCFSIVGLGVFIALLIWFSAARFEILSHQFRMVTDIYGIAMCVRQHIKLLRFAQEVIIAFRSVILSIIIICTWAIVASGLTIVSRSMLKDKIQFLTLCISALMEVYVCAWPADYLIDASTNVAQAVYESLWYNQDKIFQKNLNFILLRSQTATTVTVSILPALSLQYYASVRICKLKNFFYIINILLKYNFPHCK